MRIRTHSVLLSLCGLILAGIGAYFVFLRPPLLPEDLRAMGAKPEGSGIAELEGVSGELNAVAPGLSLWLKRVFWVMGGYMISTGVLTLYVATRGCGRGAVGDDHLAGMTSICWMAFVNFKIDSDFKWPLLGFASLWATAAGSYWLDTSPEKVDRRKVYGYEEATR